MNRNITVSLGEEVIREAKIIAARDGLSVSALLRRELRRLVEADHGYRRAHQSARQRLARGTALGGGPLPDRDDLHDRAELR